MYSLCLNGHHNGSIQAKMPVLIEVDIIYHTISMVYKLPIPVQYLYILHRFIHLVSRPTQYLYILIHSSIVQYLRDKNIIALDILSVQ